ncbi:hypothetical protein [Paenibacillus sp. YYML68]|uniref:hypothetical protein n=1 Tax=Paenibacillus sp. YYML68 TaxID=2909250 RepID=UPI00248F5634|nr:hypothetical protein [Paenibacillus sp. YYML68]
MWRLELHFASNPYPDLKVVRLNELDFDTNAPALATNVQEAARTDARASWVPYRLELNREVTRAFFRDTELTKVFNWSIPTELIEFIVAYPEHGES